MRPHRRSRHCTHLDLTKSPAPCVRRAPRPGSFALLACGLLLAANASAQEGGDKLLDLINTFRASSHQCQGKQVPAAGPLASDPTLAKVQLQPGINLRDALANAGYTAARVEVISVSGLAGAGDAMQLIRQNYCSAVSAQRFSEIGISQSGNRWTVVLAQPLLSPDLGDWREAGHNVLQLTNQARSQARQCGDRHFQAAPPLTWNDKLAGAALAHSKDMAQHTYFSHAGRDGSHVGERAQRQGYTWRVIGENIASGQGSPEKVVSGWISSPEHCENIMNPAFTEMGTAYALNRDSDTVIYWTQVFGKPR